MQKEKLKKLKNQIKDIEHKQTTHLVSTLHEHGVQTVVIGDVRDIRQNLDVGSKNNQKLHQWSHGSVRHMLAYKAERLGMVVALQEERSTSKTSPNVDTAARARSQDECFTARIRSAASPGIEMELGLTTFDKSIVGNLVSPT